MKILIISGFLGAGKTTFIQTLAKNTARDFVIYENEFGETNVDAETLKQDELSIWESTENCICCTGKTDFANAVLTISNALDPEYLVVEPSGVARLSALLENIGRVCYDRIGLLQPVTLVDGRSFVSQRKSAPELWEDQVRAAQTILCTKTESLLPAETEQLRALLSELNPAAELVTEPYSQLPALWWEHLLESACTDMGSRPARRGAAFPATESMEQITLHGFRLPSPAHLFLLLDDIVNGTYGHILRAKGVADCGNAVYLKFDVVDGAWNVTGADCDGTDGAQLCAVFIGKKLSHGKLRRLTLPADGVLRGRLFERPLKRNV